MFQKLLSVAQSKGARFVAPIRRHYPGSTEHSAEELSLVLGGGDDAKKDAELQSRGLEIAPFIDNFIVKNKLPAISEDGKTGGIVLLGGSWVPRQPTRLSRMHYPLMPVLASGYISDL
ncbi:hypothetical protein DXG01_001216 [Tephrocybe rancida]|nr:hypothetical protein DXG01_001216 [Tephrocybe rancida]